MTDKPKAYATAEHFARARADIAHRRAQLIESEKAARAVLAGHDAAIALIDSEIAEIDACERLGAAIAERYSNPPGSKRTPMSKLRHPKAGRPYEPEENARIEAASRGHLEQLAHELGRPYPGLLKQHEILLKQQRETEKTDTPASDAAPEVESGGRARASGLHDEDIVLDRMRADDPTPENPGSENSPIVEPTVAATEQSRSQAEYRTRTLPAKSIGPVRSVTGKLLDNGPLDQRVYE